MLLSVTRCNVNASDNDLTTPLHMAAIQGKESIFELLVSLWFCEGCNLEKKYLQNGTDIYSRKTVGKALQRYEFETSILPQVKTKETISCHVLHCHPKDLQIAVIRMEGVDVGEIWNMGKGKITFSKFKFV